MGHQDIFSITPTRAGFALSGELDTDGTGPLMKAAAAGPDGGLTLDLTGLTFIDCAGLNTLVGIRARLASRHRRLTICGTTPGMRRVFALGGVGELLNAER